MEGKNDNGRKEGIERVKTRGREAERRRGKEDTRKIQWRKKGKSGEKCEIHRK